MEMAVLKGDKTTRQISSASAYRAWFNYTRSYYRLVVSNMFFLFHEKIWDVILPIDELHHFSRWLLHHQPVIRFQMIC